MEGNRLEMQFLDAMTAVARLVLQPDSGRTYDVTMDNAGQFIAEFFDCSHGGAAYAIWMKVSDYLDDPRGPMTEEACEQVGRKVATEWLSVDQSSPEAVSTFLPGGAARSLGQLKSWERICNRRHVGDASYMPLTSLTAATAPGEGSFTGRVLQVSSGAGRREDRAVRYQCHADGRSMEVDYAEPPFSDVTITLDSE